LVEREVVFCGLDWGDVLAGGFNYDSFSEPLELLLGSLDGMTGAWA